MEGNMPGRHVPKFRNPPVIETVMGVEFATIPGFEVPFFGVFWNRIRERYPSCETKPILAPRIETFGAPQGEEARVQMMSTPEARCWFVSEDESEVIQLQNDRLVFNWRKRGGNDKYPGYDEFMKPSFIRLWNEFHDFLGDNNLASPQIIQAEITYVSHIPKHEGWNRIADWSEVFTSIAPPRADGILSNPESAAFGCTFVLPDGRTRLRFDAKHAFRPNDANEVIALNILARGKPESSELQSVVDWFDEGRRWVVRGFADFTTDKMHKHWEIENAAGN
jgi:uncharacterized protein (TIGR04255 family)